MTPSFIGLIATMLPGVRPSMSLASLPTASTRPFTLLIATIDGSLTTMPLPRAYTHVLAVPKSIARSLENSENSDRKLKARPLLFLTQFVDHARFVTLETPRRRAPPDECRPCRLPSHDTSPRRPLRAALPPYRPHRASPPPRSRRSAGCPRRGRPGR